MTANIHQIKGGVGKYLETELAMKTSGFPQFLTYFMMPMVEEKTEHIVNSLKDNPLASEFLCENGEVDIDLVYNCAKSAIQKTGTVELMGIRFNEGDIDSLYRHITHNS